MASSIRRRSAEWTILLEPSSSHFEKQNAPAIVFYRESFEFSDCWILLGLLSDLSGSQFFL